MKRALVALAVAGVAATALTGCTKPTPGVSVVSGTTSQHKEAVCWAAEGSLSQDTCGESVISEASASAAPITVMEGDVVGISVDTSVADIGWFPIVNSQRLTQEPLHTTYYRFTYDKAMSGQTPSAALAVVAGDGQQARGLWLFNLDPVAS